MNMAEQLVYKSNSLIESSYRLTVVEQRIILACIAQVRRDEDVTDNVMYSVTASDISELTGSALKDIYSELKSAALSLKRREVWIKMEPNGKNKKSEVMITGWVQTIVYKQDQGRVDLRFSKDILPYISQLKSHFTCYRLKELGAINSAHAIRLFELLIQYRNIGQRDIAIDQLKELMQLEDKYPKTAELKRRVIDPAIKQINKHTSLDVSYDQRKSGRKVVALTFDLKEKKIESKATEIIDQLPEKQPKKVLKTQAEAAKLAKTGETYPQLFARLNREGYIIKFKPSYD